MTRLVNSRVGSGYEGASEAASEGGMETDGDDSQQPLQPGNSPGPTQQLQLPDEKSNVLHALVMEYQRQYQNLSEKMGEVAPKQRGQVLLEIKTARKNLEEKYQEFIAYLSVQQHSQLASHYQAEFVALQARLGGET